MSRGKAAGNPRKRVNQIVRTLKARVQRCGNEAVIGRTLRLHQELSGALRGGTPDAAAYQRLKEIEAMDLPVGQKYDMNVQRELLLIVLARAVNIGSRILAGSILFVDGDRESINLIHRAYPGLMPAIVAATK